MTHLTKVLVWYLFAATYILIFSTLFVFIPETWLYDLIYGHNIETDAVHWDNVQMTLLLALALIINGMIIFISSWLCSKFHS
ncbi:hypothetical protein [Franconibacter helveticus]|uniref:hypothetical protein n=1 Tax=Franconibacter helveticus TaxID=357240 RepID=UPI00066CF4BC|nr:hypothetical protein [Franconibacter helveticus]